MAFSNHDIVSDSPTNNFATLNAIYEGEGGGSGTLSEGNLKWATTSGHRRAVANIAHGSKFYVEYVCNANGGPSNVHSLGFVQISNPTGTVNSIDLYFNNYTNGSHANRVNGSNTVVVAPAEYVYTGDVIGLCLDPDTGHGWYSINGDWKQNGNPSTGTNPVFVNIPSNDWTVYNYNANNTGTYNFGQDPTFGGTKTPSGGTNSDGSYPDKSEAGIGGFFYEPPAGALALCTANLPEMTPNVGGDVPQDYFKCLTYSGTFSQQDIAVGFKPDLVWVKSRTQTYGHMLYDTVRGQAHLNSDTPDAEVSDTQLAFHSTDGFTVSAPSGELNDTTGAPNNYIAWCWKAGGAPTADNSNTSGAMTANSVSLNGTLQSNYTPAGSPTIYPKRMSINTDAGFSIVKYTGTGNVASVPHGLDKAPEMVIVKKLTTDTGGNNWAVYHKSVNENYFLYLNGTLAKLDYPIWNDTPPSSTVITLGDDSQVGEANRPNIDTICYAWHSVEGYSKFGSYTGNGSADGPFIYCGFRPAFVMIKRTASVGNWILVDTARNTNGVGARLYADLSDAEYSGDRYDQLSNGFKIRNLSTESNASSETYIFMALAEQPFKYANAR